MTQPNYTDTPINLLITCVIVIGALLVIMFLEINDFIIPDKSR